MKQKPINKDKIPSFKDFLDSSIEESIEESYASYGGTNSIGTVQSSSKNKYSPATVMKAPPIRHSNPDIMIGQHDKEMQSRAPMLYPFESIFTELVELYTRFDSLQRTVEGAQDMATLSDAKQALVKDAANELGRIRSRIRSVIENMEEVTI